jgi:hypothetical protein
MVKNMTLPNFLIIGAAKSGTSSLYRYLKQHPDIFMSPIKEPHYFSFDSESKMTNGPGDPIRKAITDFDQYVALFDSVKDEKAIGEASTSYLYRPEAPQRIHNLLTDVKLIAILRNPVERAFSAYMHVVRDEREKASTFSEALELESKRIAENWDPIWHFTEVGFYCEQLSRYYAQFNKDQIKVYLYEELLTGQEALIKDVFRFLDVDDHFSPDFSVKFNVSGEQKTAIIQYLNKVFFLKPNPVRWVSRKVIPELWRWKFTTWVRHKNLRKRQIPEESRKELISRYRNNILKLQTLIEKDLSNWLK